MALIAFKILASAGYEDGDSLDVFNGRRIRSVHANHICHIKLANFNGSGLRDSGTFFEDYQNLIYQYKFTRINRTEIERFDGIVTDTFGPSKIDVQDFIERRIKSKNHRIFGTTGNEVWYGGRSDFSNKNLNSIWTMIESRTSNLEVNFKDWPAGSEDLRKHLFISIQDISESEVQDLISPLLSGNTIIKRRKNFADWKSIVSILSISEDDVLDPNKLVDLRQRVALNHNLFIQTKI